MLANLSSFGRLILGTLKDLTPIILVVAFFQLVVLRQPFPDLGEVFGGLTGHATCVIYDSDRSEAERVEL